MLKQPNQPNHARRRLAPVPSLLAFLPSCVLCSALALVIAVPAAATTTTWEYTATVRNYYTPSAGWLTTLPAEFVAAGIDVGTLVTGFFVVDDTLPDALPGDPITGSYEGALLDGELVAGDLTLTFTAPGGLTTALDRNVGPTPPMSLHLLYGNAPSSSVPGLLNPMLSTFQLQLADSGQDVITTEGLPTLPPDLADLDPYNGTTPWTTAVAFGFGAIDSGFVQAELTSLTVPEPRTGLFLGLGLFAAIRASRNRREAPSSRSARRSGAATESGPSEIA